MFQKRIKIAVMVAVVSAVGLSAPIYADCGSPPGSLESLDYLGRNVEKEDFKLSDFQGKIVVLSFWASWCKPCLKELPLLEVMKREDKNDELAIVAVNFGERRQKFVRFLKKWKIEREMLMLHDPKGRAQKVLGVEAIPATYVFDAAGELKLSQCGYSESGFTQLIDNLNAMILEQRRATSDMPKSSESAG